MKFSFFSYFFRQSHSGKPPLKEPYDVVEICSNAVKEISKHSHSKSEKTNSDKNPPKKLESEDLKSPTKASSNKKSVDKKISSEKSSKTDLSARSNETQHATKKISGVRHDDVLIPGPSKVTVPKAPAKNELEVFTQIKPDVFIPVPPQTKVSISKPPAKHELEKLPPNKPGSLSPLLDIHTVRTLVHYCFSYGLLKCNTLNHLYLPQIQNLSGLIITIT